MVRWLKRGLPPEFRLGPLEAHLLSLLRRRGDATVRELISENELDVAYTTAMTTLDRLYKKGLVERVSDGGRARAFRYRPKQTERDFFRTILGAGLQRLLASGLHPSAPLSFLVDTVTEHDTALLNELARAVNRKRRELRGREER